MVQTVPILLFGQSNADFHLAGPLIVKEAFADPRILVLDDGAGYRGLLGQPATRQPNGFRQALADQQSDSQRRKVQSIALPCAASLLHHAPQGAVSRVVIRSEAQGSRGLLGRQRGSQQLTGIYRNADGGFAGPFRNLVSSARSAIMLARADGGQVHRVFVLFMHGEQDRGMTASAYLAGLDRMVDDFQVQLEDLAVAIDWLILEPGGTTWQGNGNAWQPRLAMQRLSQLRDDVHVAGAGYGYPLADGIHYAAGSKALIGEMLGAALAARIGRTMPCLPPPGTTDWLLNPPRPVELRRSGNRLTIRFDGNIDLTRNAADPLATRCGFSLSCGSPVGAVEQTAADEIHVQIPSLIERNATTLCYAYLDFNRQRSGFSPSLFPVGRGGLRNARTLNSLTFSQKRISQWLPCFRLDPQKEGPLTGTDILHGMGNG